MSGKRIVEQADCEHGLFVAHGVTLPNGEYRAFGCRGGSSRTLTEGQYVLIEKESEEWPLGVPLGHAPLCPVCSHLTEPIETYRCRTCGETITNSQGTS